MTHGRGGYWLPIRGVSMWPATRPCWCRVSASRDAEIGDLVAFLSEDGRVWMHRVVAFQGEQIVTRGDTQVHSDEPMAADAILGRIDRLSVGPLCVALPQAGARALLQRRMGLAWARIAPTLRIAYRNWRKV